MRNRLKFLSFYVSSALGMTKSYHESLDFRFTISLDGNFICFNVGYIFERYKIFHNSYKKNNRISCH